MDMEYSHAIERQIEDGLTVLRPGWVRLNFNYFIDEEEFEYLLRAIELVAEHGWRLLPYYQFDTGAGVWRYQGRTAQLAASLNDWQFADVTQARVAGARDPLSLNGYVEAAEAELLRVDRQAERYELDLSEDAEKLRWFVLPQEIDLQSAEASVVGL